MYITYWNRKTLARALLLVVLLVVAGFGGYQILQTQEEAITSLSQNPVYQGDLERHAVALAVNVDWGGEFLPQILDLLESNQVQATFFLTGRWATNNPGLTKEIAAAGHELGNHGFSHAQPANLSKVRHKEEIMRTAEVIKSLTGQEVRLFAPPYGDKAAHMLEAADELGYTTVYWTVDTVDWQEGASPQEIIEKVTARAENGAIILTHPTAVTVEYLPEMLKQLKAAGYTFEKVGSIISQ